MPLISLKIKRSIDRMDKVVRDVKIMEDKQEKKEELNKIKS
jgi:hypothetical protein